MGTKSSVASGMGVALSVVQLLIKAVKDAGGTEESIRFLTKPKAKGFLREVGNRIVKASHEVFEIWVDYTRPFDKHVVDGRYDWVASSEVTEAHFRFPLEDDTAMQAFKFRLFRFRAPRNCHDYTRYVDRLLEQMKSEGFRPAPALHLLAFGSAELTREIQREHSVVALGTIWNSPSGYARVTRLCGDSKTRILDTVVVGQGFGNDCRVLGIRAFPADE